MIKTTKNGNAAGVIIIVLAVAAAAYYFLVMRNNTPTLNSLNSSSPTPSPTLSSSPSPSATAPATGTIKSFTVLGSPFKFSPNEIRVKKGDTVKITFKDTQGVHDLKIEGLDIGTKVIQSGQEETIQFKADRTGRFEYYCSVDGHREQGMSGTLIVE